MDLNFLGMLIRGGPALASVLPRVLLKRGLRGIRDYYGFLRRALIHERILRHEGRYVINSFIPPVPSEGFRKCLCSQVNNFVLRNVEATVPVTAVVAVTSSCPCACWHCSSKGTEAGHLTLEELRRVLGILKDYGVSRIELTGGEPLEVPGLEEVVGEFSKELTFVLIASGYGLTLDRARELKRKGLWGAAVALDHPDPETFDRMRGTPGAYRTSVEAIRNSRQAGLYTMTHTVATRALIREGKLRDLLVQLKALGVHEVRLMEPLPAGSIFMEEEALLLPEERIQLASYAKLSFRDRTLPKVVCFPADFESPERFGCAAGVQHVYVNTRGDLYPCNFLPLSLGNLLREEPQVVWGRLRKHFPFARKGCFLLEHRGELRAHWKGLLPFPWEQTNEFLSNLKDGDLLRWPEGERVTLPESVPASRNG